MKITTVNDDDYYSTWLGELQYMIKITIVHDEDYYSAWWRLLLYMIKIMLVHDEDYYIHDVQIIAVHSVHYKITWFRYYSAFCMCITTVHSIQYYSTCCTFCVLL